MTTADWLTFSWMFTALLGGSILAVIAFANLWGSLL